MNTVTESTSSNSMPITKSTQHPTSLTSSSENETCDDPNRFVPTPPSQSTMTVSALLKNRSKNSNASQITGARPNVSTQPSTSAAIVQNTYEPTNAPDAQEIFTMFWEFLNKIKNKFMFLQSY